jgi:SAM-dependent MidA family methyltransferase
MTPHAPSSTSTLPPLSADEASQSARVVAVVRTAIEAGGGWLPFDDYLRIALYAPGLGYYTAGAAKFGAAGDFITAPELSPLFGACVAQQCKDVLEALGPSGPGHTPGAGTSILELGAGSGALAWDVLQGLADAGRLPERYLILEVSAELRARQRARLEQLPERIAGRVHWLDTLPAVPFDGLVLANEVADALPFKRFRVDAGYEEIGVVTHGAGLALGTRSADSTLRTELERILGAAPPPGYVSEVCPLLDGWIAALGGVLRRGAVLLFDYGLSRSEYYHPERTRGTLRCHFRQRAHDDALCNPGLIDITAWVDFTRAAEAAVDVDLTVAGYCTQAAFLLGTGIESLLAAESTVQQARLASQARQLLLPGEMGEVFKALALTRGLDFPLQGFRLQDLRRQL